jgi:hypothetical protein
VDFVEQPAATASRAVISLVLGVVGIVLCPICSPIAWAIGRAAEGELDASGGMLGGRGLATRQDQRHHRDRAAHRVRAARRRRLRVHRMGVERLVVVTEVVPR